jgi:hypothetical protein
MSQPRELLDLSLLGLVEQELHNVNKFFLDVVIEKGEIRYELFLQRVGLNAWTFLEVHRPADLKL